MPKLKTAALTPLRVAGDFFATALEIVVAMFKWPFAWAEFWIVRPGNVGAIAFVLASYGRQIVAPATEERSLSYWWNHVRLPSR